jgi:cysteinyl-tRNA synthetase
MAMRHLGPRFDIHTGGEDNVFPHHEDEIAQSAPIVGGPPAEHWVHAAHLLMGGRKMAKSADNIQRVSDLADEGVDPLAFRYLCLTARYGRKLAYSVRSLGSAAAGLGSLRAELGALGPPPPTGAWAAPEPLKAGAAPARPAGLATGVAGHGAGQAFSIENRAAEPRAPLSVPGRALHDRFVAALDDDLDMPGALRIARQTLAAAVPADERRWLVLDMDLVLGLDLDRTWDPETSTDASREGLDAHASRLLVDRDRARAEGDYTTADRIRGELHALGVEPIDRSTGGSTWRRRQPDGTARSDRPPNRSRTR